MNLDITTEYIHPPIPNRNFDWLAALGDGGPDCVTGQGSTEREAILDLISNMAFASDPAPKPLPEMHPNANLGEYGLVEKSNNNDGDER